MEHARKSGEHEKATLICLLKIFIGVYVFQKFPRFFSVHHRVMEHAWQPIRDTVLINICYKLFYTRYKCAKGTTDRDLLQCTYHLYHQDRSANFSSLHKHILFLLSSCNARKIFHNGSCQLSLLHVRDSFVDRTSFSLLFRCPNQERNMWSLQYKNIA